MLYQNMAIGDSENKQLANTYKHLACSLGPEDQFLETLGYLRGSLAEVETLFSAQTMPLLVVATASTKPQAGLRYLLE